MVSKNKYYRRSRIGEKKFRQIIRYFSLDFSASDTARLTGISVRSINTIYIKIRIRLTEEHEREAWLVGQTKVDESFPAYAKLRLSKMKGIRREMLYLHYRESEFR
ncbi:MAG: IS1595 family transposase, partial [Candidatus Thiodiazotropha sp. 6PLUC5]